MPAIRIRGVLAALCCGLSSACLTTAAMGVPRGSGAHAAMTAAVVVPGAGVARGPAAGAQDDDLPDGPGKRLLVGACVTCHEITEITKFRGYYSRAQWRDVVVTMVEYGAPLTERDVDLLADYLTEHLGRRK